MPPGLQHTTLALAMVGLPARGKTYTARKVARYLQGRAMSPRCSTSATTVALVSALARATSSSTRPTPRPRAYATTSRWRSSGSGFAVVTQKGSEHDDELSPEGFRSNHAGGVLGGISTGQDLVVSIAIKPTSSIRLPRRSIDRAGVPTVVETHCRHDPCVGIRATPIAEAMPALVLIDHVLLHRAQNADVRHDVAPLPAASRSR